MFNNKIKTVKAATLILGVAMCLTGCKTLDEKTASSKNEIQAQTLAASRLGNQIVRDPKQAPRRYPQTQGSDSSAVKRPSQIGRVPVLAQTQLDEAPQGNGIAPVPKVKKLDAFVSPLSVPQFIDVVYGEMLGVAYVTGPEVAKMTDVVQLRSSGELQSEVFQELVAKALEDYGVRVVPNNGTYQILHDKALRAQVPKFIKSRARSRTRSDLRPIIQFVEMQALDANSMLGFLRQAFGNKNDSLTFSANQSQNFVTLAGLPAEVDAAIAIIQELDELNFAGSQIQRYTPQYWNSAEFSTELLNALTVEGWSVTDNINLNRTIFLMPVEYSNDLFIFAKTQQAHERVEKWIRELDKPIEGGDTEQIFIYQVKNVDAAILAETANNVLFSSQGGLGTSSSPVGTGAAAGANSDSLGGSAVFNVDPLGNRIIFTGTVAEYNKLQNLLEQLDTPAPEVLIEVQIAEVTLTEGSNVGVDFFLDNIGGGDVEISAGTSGSLGLGAQGLNVALLTGNVTAALNAFANNRQVKLLSTPILVARSGGQAEIQVGQDIPVITAQRAASSQSGDGPLDVLQSITYRSIGNLLSIEPIVFSDNRIDLSLTQEVSSTVDVGNTAIPSPTLSQRSISTQLSLEDGQTAVLGGLISEDYIRDEQGIPILKDIPIIGQAFSNDALSVNRTELVILITAYVLRGQNDKDQFVNRLGGRVDRLLADESRFVTLLPKKF